MSEGQIFSTYKYGRKTELHTDACKQGYGAILLQEAEDGKLHPVYYMSKKTNTAEEKKCEKGLITGIARWLLEGIRLNSSWEVSMSTLMLLADIRNDGIQ
ncbi:retrovirus-related Pol polyprotein from transposon 17.6 [Trichonephila clavipes]|nr:retrovirus-related Pol polyprotein from transposon 17.6 [Trichonephila clavipes]